jgi:hypothetical protein
MAIAGLVIIAVVAVFCFVGPLLYRRCSTGPTSCT